MSALEERSLDNLADVIYNVMWQDLLEIFRVIRNKMAAEGQEAVKAAFIAGRQRFLEGPFEDHVEVRWGMNLCVHCNDDNIEKNGIAYVRPNGDGLEFNQCLNCRIGILYDLETAKATMDSYVIGLGNPGQFNGMSIYWTAIGPDELSSFQPTYEVIQDGQWLGTFSLDSEKKARFLPFEAMTDSVGRGDEDPWTTDIPADLQEAINQFMSVAMEQIEVAIAIAQ